MNGYLNVPGLPSPPSADRMICLLNMLLGQPSTGSCPNAPVLLKIVSPILGGLFNILDLAALGVSGILIGYWVVSQTITVSHTGSDALRKTGIIWMPIRICFASAMLFPTSSGGLSIGQQLIVENAAKVGIALGDWGYSTASSKLRSGAYQLLPPPPPDVSGLSKSLLESLVCEDILNNEYSGQAISTSLSQTGTNAHGNTDYSVLQFQAVGNSQYSGDPCGIYILPNASALITSSSSTPGNTWTTPVSTTAAQTVQAAQIGALQSMIQQLSPIAQSIANNITNPQGTPGSGQRAKCFQNQDQQCLNQPTQFPTPSYQSKNPAGGFVGSMTGIDHQYEGTVMQAAQSGGNVGLIQQSQFGFFGAGEVFRNLALHEKSVAGAVHSLPTPTAGGIDISIDPAVQEGISEVNDYVANYGYSGASSSSMNPVSAASTTACRTENGLSLVQQIPCDVETDITQGSINDPVVSFINLGIHLEDIAAGILGVGAVGGLLNGGIAKVGLIFGEWIGFPGTLMAELMPLVPSLLWIFFIISYLALVLEAMAAAPLWFLAHLDPSQEGIAGAYGTTGYKLLLGVVFRPILGVLGLFVGIILAEFGLMLAYSLCTETVGTIGHASSGHEIFSTISTVFIFAVVSVVVMFKSMELITYLPEVVMRWIGGPMDSMGEHGAVMKGVQIVLEKAKEGFKGMRDTIDEKRRKR